MVVDRSNVDHIMRGLQSTEGVRLHNHRKKLRQRFDIIKKLGQGTYGKVQLGINKETGQEVAIKTIKKCKIETEADLVRIRREIQIMSSVRHPNIIHIYEVFENREKIVLVMEYAAGGELYDYLSERKVLEETEARRIFRQISTAIYYCHKHKICHRDLKLENILLDEHGSAKIADFGLSNVFDGQRLLSTYCGSPLYASPEIVKGTPYHGPEVDCWSLGVLLYTLVYGAMPFDGSNFKRLVKQISQGDYFEPKKASSASPLIRDMLTVNSPDRATIEQICSHWWVNQGFNVSCLDIAEDLANQTPVRLDLLLSLAPPPENTEKIVVTDDQKTVPQEAPPRSMSVGSFMELDQNAEDRVRSFVAREVPSENVANEKTMKRKLEPVPSKSFSGARKKERTKPETEEEKEEPVVPETEQSAKKVESNNVVMDVDAETNKSSEKVKSEEGAKVENKTEEKIVEKPAEEPVEVPVIKNEKTEKPEPPKPEVEKPTDVVSKDKPTRKSVKVVKKKVPEKKDSEVEKKDVPETDTKGVVKKKKTDSPAPSEEPKKIVKEEKPQEEVGKEIKRDSTTRKSKGSVKQPEPEEKEKTPKSEESPTKTVERRKSKIFETAEKFMTSDQKGSPPQEKPKKVYIPGVKVSDFAKAFERRSSVPSTPPLKSSPSRKTLIKEPDKNLEDRKSPEKKSKSPEVKKDDNSSQSKTQKEPVEETKKKEESPKAESKEPSPEKKSEEEHKPTPINDEKIKKLKDSARNIISNALAEEERKKVKKQVLKPPVPRTKTEDLDARKKSLTLQIGKETAVVQVHTPENTKFLFEPEGEAAAAENKENIEKPKEKKTAKLEITLKSNTLPRRTSKAELRLASPQVKKEIENFKTEVEQRVGDPSHVYSTQRSEVSFPVSAAQKPIRSMSLEPESRPRLWQSRERIIPIQVEGGHKEEGEARDRVKELDRPHEGRPKLPYTRTQSLRSTSLSRQSTQDSDTESTMSVTGEPIKKSPREFIIPIAVEGGGYVTPRATSLEPSESMSSKRGHRPFSRKFSLFSDNGSEDESPFSTLSRHSSRDVDEPFRLHRLRSSRPARTSVDKGDSGSGSEEEEDDDGFELLTAENLFSTLLSRVRSLTQRLNVEDGMRPGFPSSRLLSNHFGPSDRLFSNFHQPLTRLPERSEFGRSLSRDMENGSNRFSRSDLRNSDSNRSVPRGNSKSKRSDSDTESISESSATTSQSRRHKTDEERKAKKSQRHAKTRSGPTTLTENEEITEYVPTFDGNRSLYVPNRMWAAKAYEKRNSDSEIMAPHYRSGIPKLLRPTSLLLERVRRESEDREDSPETKRDFEGPKEKDFYDILAEKYGITNVMRYDLPRERRTSFERMRYGSENRRSCGSDVGKDSENESEKSKKEELKKESTSQAKPKKEEPAPEKYKTPSEKLAAVLSRLEKKPSDKKESTSISKREPNTVSKKETTPVPKKESTPVPKRESTPADKKSNSDSLSTLSPAALELYEKTLAEYKKLKKNGEKEKFENNSEDTKKSRIPKKVTTRHQSDMSVSELEKNQRKWTVDKERKTPEKSVLSKYFRQSSTEMNSEKSKNEENEDSKKVNEVEKNEIKKQDTKNPKSKFLTSLERKLEKLRASSERKYVDKAIRSLRESSLGPKDVSSENVLIKRAVSLSDCPSYKPGQTGKIQSTVNSVLGMFKKFENPEAKKKEKPEPVKEEKSKIPVFKKPEIVETKVEPLKPRQPDPIQVSSLYTRRPSYFTGNGFSFHNSYGSEDSPTYLSPDLDNLDSWSYCSDLGNPDDVIPHGKYSHRYGTVDDVSKESVSDRIRRKSFYTRFNEKKKPRRSSLLTPRTNYPDQEGEGSEGKLPHNRSFSTNPTEGYSRPSYYRSVSSGDEYTKKSYDDTRPRPFYKTSDTTGSRKNSFDWSRTTGNPSYLRSNSQSPSFSYSSLTLPRNFSTYDSGRSYRSSLYGTRSPDIERPYSPTSRPYSPISRPYSPRPVSPSFSSYSRSQTPNNFE